MDSCGKGFISDMLGRMSVYSNSPFSVPFNHCTFRKELGHGRGRIVGKDVFPGHWIPGRVGVCQMGELTYEKGGIGTLPDKEMEKLVVSTSNATTSLVFLNKQIYLNHFVPDKESFEHVSAFMKGRELPLQEES